jgi:hypothetical protein
MSCVSNYFNSRGLFFDRFPLCDSKQARTVLEKCTGEAGRGAPIAEALLKLGSALFDYNASTRFYIQKAVVVENSIRGLYKKVCLTHTALEKEEWGALIYTIGWLAGYQQRGEALVVARDLLDELPTSTAILPDFNKTLRIIYDLTYLGLYFSPKGSLFVTLLKISKVVYFGGKEWSVGPHEWGKIRATIQNPTLAGAIDLLARGIHLYGNGLQLYTAGKAFFK